MSGIFNGLQALIDTILGPFKILIFVIREIVAFGELIVATVENLFLNIATMPQILINYAILGVSIVILLRILGRDTK